MQAGANLHYLKGFKMQMLKQDVVSSLFQLKCALGRHGLTKTYLIISGFGPEYILNAQTYYMTGRG